jgi:hypothetical protein
MMANKVVDITGKKYGRLTVIGFSHIKDHVAYWNVLCDCGNEKTLRGGSFKFGAAKSCGCLLKEIVTKHGMKGTPTYHTWIGMIKRCKNPNSHGYKNYGSRGISVCDKWLNFEGFYEDMGIRPEGTTLDRIDNDGNYNKENCKWSTKKEQDNNTRVNHFITYKGKTQTITQWSEEIGINISTLKSRICQHNWSIEKAFTTKTRKRA